MLTLIESGGKDTFFERFKSAPNYYDFPAGLIVYYNNNTWEIFGNILSGDFDTGCGCCSRPYDVNNFGGLSHWELYEVTPPAAAQPPKLLL